MSVSLHKVDKQANVKQTIAVDIHQTPTAECIRAVHLTA